MDENVREGFQYPKRGVDSAFYGLSRFQPSLETAALGNRVSIRKDLWGCEDEARAPPNAPKEGCGMDLYLYHLCITLNQLQTLKVALMQP